MYKVEFHIAIFTRGKFYYGGGGNMLFSGEGGEGGGILLSENCIVIFPEGNSRTGENHSHLPGGNSNKHFTSKLS